MNDEGGVPMCREMWLWDGWGVYRWDHLCVEEKKKVLCIHTFKHLKKSQLDHPVCRTQGTIFNGQSMWLWSSGTLVSRLSQFHYGFQRSCAHVVSIAPIYFAECRKNPLMWNMKQPKRAIVSHHACWPELDKFLQRAAHYLHISWFSLPFHWPDLWLQCAALHLSNRFLVLVWFPHLTPPPPAPYRWCFCACFCH